MAIDRNILVSLHGNRLGLNTAGDLIADGRVMAPNAGNPVSRVTWFTDFLGDTLPAELNYQEGSDTAATFALVAAKSGTAVLTTAASATVTMAVNGAQVDGGSLNWYASNGGLSFETRISLSAITTGAWFFGFTDQTSALEMPWTISATTYTSNSTDGFGFLFDTGATSATIRCVGVATDVDGTAVDTSDAWAATTYKKFRCECDTSGTAKFYIDGLLVGTIALAVTTTVALVPVIAGFARAASARAATIDYIWTAQDR